MADLALIRLALTGLNVAITRPSDQATRLSRMIVEAGGKPHPFPLIEIAPLADYSAFDAQLHELGKYDWTIFISSNAVQNAIPRMLNLVGKPPATLHHAAIGPVTAAELTSLGIAPVLTPQGRYDSESLLALPEMQQVKAKRFLIFRGVGGRELLAESLRVRGATVDFAECYRRINPQTSAEPLAQRWEQQQLDAVVVTSSEAMRHLLTMTNNGQQAWIRDVTLCVNHARIAELPLDLGLHVRIAEAPGDDAMLQCLNAVALLKQQRH
ncbi:uroporphyrinogen-III synthase [Methylovorus menthalis]|uniref:uroporphyrinogen-III synthase n=1 Tax=Methylovorus menthalis TaxID=1002227 RepID=UPI001E6409E5|nr:uroporphyrinogen-III synthase [Methylovorus menthalis]MCB4810150.1 uroporphyrinogen-III synthase [Methylovorus menthalis]